MNQTNPEAGSLRRPVLDPERLERLWRLDVLDTPPEAAFDRLTTLAGRMLGVPVALVSFVDEDRQVFKSCHGTIPEPWMSARETPLSHSFCQHVVDRSKPLIVSDAEVHPLVRENLAVPDLGVRAYAGIPITTPEGYVLGSFCAIDAKPRTWTEEELSSLTILAESLNTEIALRLSIIDERRLSDELREARERAEAAALAKDQLLANVSHQLRTPLSGIIGFAALLDDERLDEEQRAHLGVVSDSANALLRSVEGLIGFTETLTGTAERKPEAFDPHQLLQALIRQTPSDVSGPEPDVRLDRKPDLPNDLTGKPESIRTSVRELLRNAIDFGQGSAILIEASMDVDEDGATSLRVTVSDGGIGIDPRRRQAIFEPLTGHDGSGGVHRGGLGMGLALARAHAEAAGGALEVDGSASEGSRFVLTVPVTAL